MDPDKVSVSALISAFARAYHATHDDPKIFDDYLAIQLFTDEEQAMFSNNLARSLQFFDPERAAATPEQAAALAAAMRIQLAPITLSRARYAEDRLELAVQNGVRQYVILGAGFDTFAFRRPDLLRELHVFELDHPATQAYKSRRLAELGWQNPASLHYIPTDFTQESLSNALAHSDYAPQALSFFSWLGVTYYLDRDIIFATLRAIGGVAPAGSAVVFDYPDTDAFVPDKAAVRMQRMQAASRQSGEPMKGGLDPATLAADLAALGLHLRENLSPSDIELRYFQGRADGYHAFEQVHFAEAVVA